MVCRLIRLGAIRYFAFWKQPRAVPILALFPLSMVIWNTHKALWGEEGKKNAIWEMHFREKEGRELSAVYSLIKKLKWRRRRKKNIVIQGFGFRSSTFQLAICMLLLLCLWLDIQRMYTEKIRCSLGKEFRVSFTRRAMMNKLRFFYLLVLLVLNLRLSSECELVRRTTSRE